MSRVKVKICCISNVREALMAVDHGASALGLVGKMPGGPGIIDDAMIAAIARVVPPAVSTFLLSSETTAGNIIRHYKRVHTSTIQLVDELSDNLYRRIRAELPHVKLVQVIHVMNEHSVDQALEVAGEVDAILLDSGNPTLAVKELGGTGRVHNWQLSKKIREQAGLPVFLAGGLNSENIVEAIDLVQPFGIDLCSGVRTNGGLDEVKLEKLFNVLRTNNL